ncbi:MAG: DUF123 domain-containing protein [Candidatus Hermodarchaeota archaeon]
MKGSYILVISISENIDLIVGALGEIPFEEGFYLYIGSGMGSNGSATLERRVNRHLYPSTEKKIHWHIDYLLNHEKVMIIKLYLIPSFSRLECIIAGELAEFSDGFISNFGSSDCQCQSHLLYFKHFKNFK